MQDMVLAMAPVAALVKHLEPLHWWQGTRLLQGLKYTESTSPTPEQHKQYLTSARRP